MEVVLAFFILVSIVLAYFLPTIIAHVRGHHNTLAIGVLNLVGGWSAIGWIIALVWAFTNNKS